MTVWYCALCRGWCFDVCIIHGKTLHEKRGLITISLVFWSFFLSSPTYAPLTIHNPLIWRYNGRDGVSNHQPHECLLNRLFRRTSKRASKLRVTGLCARNSPGTGEFPAQMASNADNGSIWWRHHAIRIRNAFRLIWDRRWDDEAVIPLILLIRIIL